MNESGSMASSMEASAICLGEIGRWGVLSAASPEPVTAQVIMTERFIVLNVEAKIVNSVVVLLGAWDGC